MAGVSLALARRAGFLSVVAACALALASCSPQSSQQASSPARPIKLSVDATDIGRKIYHAHLQIPAKPGPLTLVYPKWIPGEHGPTGPITDLVGLKVQAAGKSIPWRRDDVDMYAFHVEVPAGEESVDVALDFLSAASTEGFSSAASATPHLAIVTWNQLVVYPEGAKTDDVMVDSSLVLPEGWKSATSLTATAGQGPGLHYAQVSLTTLVDSPVLAGEYMKVVPLAPAPRPVELDIAADSEKALAISDEQVQAMQHLVAEADALFGARHFDQYHFLLTLSDHVAHFGLEHHQSNDTRLSEDALTDHSLDIWVLSHEFMHSWNGKYRRPAGLATPDFQQPMKGELLWVYEGLTEYLGTLLAVRSGMWTEDTYRDDLAEQAAYFDRLPGRDWRPLIDTTVAAQLLYNAPKEWSAYRRGVDFYDEGWLIWLDADTKIRELTKGQKSLDDFCRAFHGGTSGSPAVKPYTVDDVVSTLNDVAANDWRAFFTARLERTGGGAPLEGLARSGWKLAYNDTRNPFLVFEETHEPNVIEDAYSLGLRIGEKGELIDVLAGSPAYAAGLGAGMMLVEVNGKPWSRDGLRAAITASAHSKAPLSLVVDNDKVRKTVTLDYHGGPVEPHLERTSGLDLFHEILKARR
jgi:predicted metalloprotease with PDZ domain